jgi:hypothetical protein
MKNRKKVVIITDSVSMPRPEVPYESTWISLLKNRFQELDVIDRPERGSTSMRLVHEGGGGYDLLEAYMPACVILQMGLAECAPRLFKKNGFERRFINYLPRKIRDDYINGIRETRGRKPEFTDVPPEQFRNNIFNFAARCLALRTELVIITILRATDLFIQKSPHICRNIGLYNSIYEEAAGEYNNITILDPVSEQTDVNKICLDELHINSEGHKLYFKAVESYFRRKK